MSACNAGDLDSTPGLGSCPGEGDGNPLQYSCLEKSPEWRSLVGYSPWGHKELDKTERLHYFITTHMTNADVLELVCQVSPQAPIISVWFLCCLLGLQILLQISLHPASRWRQSEKEQPPAHRKNMAWAGSWLASLSATFPLTELRHRSIPNSKGGWEMWSRCASERVKKQPQWATQQQCFSLQLWYSQHFS